jgi:hypothetical protein
MLNNYPAITAQEVQRIIGLAYPATNDFIVAGTDLNYAISTQSFTQSGDVAALREMINNLQQQINELKSKGNSTLNLNETTRKLPLPNP